MKLDRSTTKKLKKYFQIFKDARDSDANEADTVMYLMKFFEEVFNFDPLKGEISREVLMKYGFCDFAIKQGEKIKYLIEAKRANHKILNEKDIEQAEGYAAQSKGIHWVLLTNGIEWKLYNLTFSNSNGVTHEEIFSIKFVDDETTFNPKKLWESLSLLSKESLKSGKLEDCAKKKKATSKSNLISILASTSVLKYIRRELNKKYKARLDIKDVSDGLNKVLNKDLLKNGELKVSKTPKKRSEIQSITLKPIIQQLNKKENFEVNKNRLPKNNSPETGNIIF
ncbi:type I restriction enzyme HsdR N-terminal domain-containing protein [Candidatus Peregrinibacteria bacterium]|nr:type I restriction enzyme HsdR N-terminal domain-containing protein [Candidatus Peregrinibacteria bacterium]